MSIYCVGDLHGRFDLFNMLLQKIKFNPNEDKLYLLGDVIDWNFGGVQILDYIMEHQSSCTLLSGNHESHFLYMCKAYDIVMFKPQIKEATSLAVDVYSDTLFEQIFTAFIGKFHKKSIDEFYTQPSIKKWLKNGDFRVRKKLLDAMVLLADSLGYDKEAFKSVHWILSNLRGQFNTKAFAQELLKQSTDKYIRIKEFLAKIPNRVEFDYCNKHFCLMHSKSEINPQVPLFIQHPHANTENVTYIFGHDPVPQLHRKIQNNLNGFSFNYRCIFSWIDTNMNRYYWLDLASNPIAALKLDDMSEYYVGQPSTRKNAAKWDVPNDIYPVSGSSYQYVEWARLGKVSFNNAAIVTTNNGCYEFLIGISEHSKTIYYTHIGWLEYQHTFIIKEWCDNQSICDIIDKVRSDFSRQSEDPDNIKANNILHGIMTRE